MKSESIIGPKNYKCHYCSYKIKDNYCSVCRAHFILNNGIQQYVSVEMDTVEYVSIYDKLCSKCAEYYINSDATIQATSYIDYYNKLRFCKKCKLENQKFIRNMFYKNFMLYRCRINVYRYPFIMLFMILFCLYRNYKVLYIVYFLWNIRVHSYRMMLVSILCYFARDYTIAKLIYLGTNINYMLGKSKFYFLMPVNLEKTEDVHKHIKDLKINTN